MINLNKYYVAELGFELATSGCAVRRAHNCAMEPFNPCPAEPGYILPLQTV